MTGPSGTAVQGSGRTGGGNKGGGYGGRGRGQGYGGKSLSSSRSKKPTCEHTQTHGASSSIVALRCRRCFRLSTRVVLSSMSRAEEQSQLQIVEREDVGGDEEEDLFETIDKHKLEQNGVIAFVMTFVCVVFRLARFDSEIILVIF
ncbi:hypothetical protein NL676_019775 [Syzygium grande]|nr:hypothetical protein NL676_019775 [Syzygium grande]